MRKAKSRAKRLRFERRIRDSHRRWQMVSDLQLGAFRFMDGLIMLKSCEYDLYCVMRDRFGPVDSAVPIEFIHPNWIAGLRQ